MNRCIWSYGQFSAGSPAVADEVNANFADADGRINTNTSAIDANTTGIDDTNTVVDQLFTAITVNQPAISRAEITAQMTCPVDTIPMSASCGCDFVDASGNDTNFGSLALCAVTLDGAVAACIPNFFYDPALAFSDALISANCTSITRVDGTTATPDYTTSNKQSKLAVSTGKTTADYAVELQMLAETVRLRTAAKQ